MQALRQNAYFGGASKDALLEMHAALKRHWWGLLAVYKWREGKLERAKVKIRNLKSERDDAVSRLGTFVSCADTLRETVTRMNALQTRAPEPDWDARLRQYLGKSAEQKDAATTQSTRKAYLAPWVKWLKEHGGRPTTQRLKNYLATRGDLMRTSYWKIGRAVRDFCNHWAESWERVELVPPHGQQREKETLAMPPEMVDAVSDLVKKRLLLFGPRAEQLQTREEASQLAKDLGK